jgi:hypothetical protein
MHQKIVVPLLFASLSALAGCGGDSKSSAKAFTNFSIVNPAATGAIALSPGGTSVMVTVPFGTDLTQLVASFTTTGITVKVGNAVQMSGVSKNDFSSPVTYTIVAADGSTANVIVTVVVGPNTAKAITSFKLGSVSGVIDQLAHTITVSLGAGAAVNALMPSFATTGVSVSVNSHPQISGNSTVDFTFPVTYTVTAADGSSQDYTVTVTSGAATSKSITQFALLVGGTSVTGTINQNSKTINVTVPMGTNVTALVVTFAFIGMSVSVNGNPQMSDVNAQNFTQPVTYVVTAADGTTASYTATVSIAGSSSKDITSFSLAGAAGTIDNGAHTIDVTVPFGTDVTALVATFTDTGTSVKIAGTAQTSGTTANDFTNPVSYVVRAADGTTLTYTVTVTVGANPAKAITAFSLAGVSGTINESQHTITVIVPSGTNLTALVATFTDTGMSVDVNGTDQVSGTTPNDFTSPVMYEVTAADSSTVSYTVTVTAQASSDKSITAFSLAGMTGTIDQSHHTIAVTVPSGTNVTALVATFTDTGASVKVGSTLQVSGTTADDFTSPVMYVVTAADNSTVTYTVTVTVAASAAKAITAFALAGVPGMINQTTKTIAVTVPFGTDVAMLAATFADTGASVSVGGTVQVSGTTDNNFTNPVMYVVTAADNSTATYTVTVSVAANPAKAITAFSLAGVAGVINEAAKTIAVTLPIGTDVATLVPTFTTTGVSVEVGTVVQVSGTTTDDFTNPVSFVVTAADNTTATYVVTVTLQ